MYHPADPNPDAEYVELYNAEDADVDLTGWRFTRGISFTFPEGTVIGKHGYLVVCRDVAVFFSVYGTGLPVAGEYLHGLSNAGEKLRLRDGEDRVVQDLDYLDEPPWPPEADGDGPSLELVDPFLDTDDPYSWRASTGAGTPGRKNSTAGLRRPISLADPHSIPDKPSPGEEVAITVKVNHTSPVRSVTLWYEIVLKDEDTGSTGSIAMADDGAGPDETAGDDIWTCSLPGQPAMTLVRYRFEAETENGDVALLPHPEAATPNRAYFVADYVESPLKLWWLVMTPSAYEALQSHVFTDDYEPAAFVSDTGKVYDRIKVRYRGVWARYAAKKSWKIVFNSDRLFRRQKRINLNATMWDPSGIRERLAYEMYK